MKESDWKLFKNIKEKAIERFCANVIEDVEEAIKKEDTSHHGRYLYLFKMLQNADKRLSLLFDGQSRSKAQLQLTLMRSEGLVENHELEGMSDALLQSTDPKLRNA